MEVPRDRLAKRVGAVRAKGQPQLERAKRPGVLERDIDRVAAVLLMGQIILLVSEGRLEHRGVAHHDDTTRLRQIQPLVRVKGGRIGALEAGERWLAVDGTAAAASP